jgi:hypothetical protein
MKSRSYDDLAVINVGYDANARALTNFVTGLLIDETVSETLAGQANGPHLPFTVNCACNECTSLFDTVCALGLDLPAHDLSPLHLALEDYLDRGGEPATVLTVLRMHKDVTPLAKAGVMFLALGGF